MLNALARKRFSKKWNIDRVKDSITEVKLTSTEESERKADESSNPQGKPSDFSHCLNRYEATFSLIKTTSA